MEAKTHVNENSKRADNTFSNSLLSYFFLFCQSFNLGSVIISSIHRLCPCHGYCYCPSLAWTCGTCRLCHVLTPISIFCNLYIYAKILSVFTAFILVKSLLGPGHICKCYCRFLKYSYHFR